MYSGIDELRSDYLTQVIVDEIKIILRFIVTVRIRTEIVFLFEIHVGKGVRFIRHPDHLGDISLRIEKCDAIIIGNS